MSYVHGMHYYYGTRVSLEHSRALFVLKERAPNHLVSGLSEHLPHDTDLNHFAIILLNTSYISFKHLIKKRLMGDIQTFNENKCIHDQDKGSRL